MSVAPSKGQSKEQAQNAAAKANAPVVGQAQAPGQAGPGTGTPSSGTGFGSGRVTFDKSGNRLVDNQLVQGKGGSPIFATTQNANTYFGDRGLANNGQVVNPAAYAKADFTAIGGKNNNTDSGFISPPNPENQPKNYNINLKETFPLSDKVKTSADKIPLQPYEKDAFFNPKSNQSSNSIISPVNKAEEGKSYGWADLSGKSQNIDNKIFTNQVSFTRGSQQEQQAKQQSISNAEKIFGSNAKAQPKTDILVGGPVTPQSAGKKYGTGDRLVRNTPQEASAISFEAQKASKIYNAKTEEKSAFDFSKTFSNNSKGVNIDPLTGLPTGNTPAEKQARANYEFGLKQSEQPKPNNDVLSPSSNSKTDYSINIYEGVPIGDTISGGGKSGKSSLSVSQSLTPEQLFSSAEKSGVKYVSVFNASGNVLGKVQANKEGLRTVKQISESQNISFGYNDFQIPSTVKTALKSGNVVTVFDKNNKPVGLAFGPKGQQEFATLISKAGRDSYSFNIENPKSQNEIIKSVEKNPQAYEKQPNSYWENLGMKGYLNEQGMSKINSIFHAYERQQNIPVKAQQERNAGFIAGINARNDPFYNFNVKDEKGNIVKTTTGQRSFYDFMKSQGYGKTKTQEVGPYKTRTVEAHFSNTEQAASARYNLIPISPSQGVEAYGSDVKPSQPQLGGLQAISRTAESMGGSLIGGIESAFIHGSKQVPKDWWKSGSLNKPIQTTGTDIFHTFLPISASALSRGQIRARNVELTPEASNLANRTSAPNIIGVLSGKEPPNPNVSKEYYDVQAGFLVYGAVETGRGLVPLRLRDITLDIEPQKAASPALPSTIPETAKAAIQPRPNIFSGLSSRVFSKSKNTVTPQKATINTSGFSSGIDVVSGEPKPVSVGGISANPNLNTIRGGPVSTDLISNSDIIGGQSSGISTSITDNTRVLNQSPSISQNGPSAPLDLTIGQISPGPVSPFGQTSSGSVIGASTPYDAALTRTNSKPTLPLKESDIPKKRMVDFSLIFGYGGTRVSSTGELMFGGRELITKTASGWKFGKTKPKDIFPEGYQISVQATRGEEFGTSHDYAVSKLSSSEFLQFGETTGRFYPGTTKAVNIFKDIKNTLNPTGEYTRYQKEQSISTEKVSSTVGKPVLERNAKNASFFGKLNFLRGYAVRQGSSVAKENTHPDIVPEVYTEFGVQDLDLREGNPKAGSEGKYFFGLIDLSKRHAIEQAKAGQNEIEKSQKGELLGEDLSIFSKTKSRLFPIKTEQKTELQDLIANYISERNFYSGGAYSISKQIQEGSFRTPGDVEVYFKSRGSEKDKEIINTQGLYLLRLTRDYYSQIGRNPSEVGFRTNPLKSEDTTIGTVFNKVTNKAIVDIVPRKPMENDLVLEVGGIKVRQAKQVISDKENIINKFETAKKSGVIINKDISHYKKALIDIELYNKAEKENALITGKKVNYSSSLDLKPKSIEEESLLGLFQNTQRTQAVGGKILDLKGQKLVEYITSHDTENEIGSSLKPQGTILGKEINYKTYYEPIENSSYKGPTFGGQHTEESYIAQILAFQNRESLERQGASNDFIDRVGDYVFVGPKAFGGGKEFARLFGLFKTKAVEFKSSPKGYSKGGKIDAQVGFLKEYYGPLYEVDFGNTKSVAGADYSPPSGYWKSGKSGSSKNTLSSISFISTSKQSEKPSSSSNSSIYSGKSSLSGRSGPSSKSTLSGLSGKSSLSGRSGPSSKSTLSGLSGKSSLSGRSGPSGRSTLSAPSNLSGSSSKSGPSGRSGVSGFSGLSGLSGLSSVSGKSGSSIFSTTTTVNKIIIPPLLGNFTRTRKSKTKQGPTALYQFSTKNIFASSLDINIPKNQRYIY